MIFPQMLLDLHHELIVDLFAGGGGASCGIEMALGRQVDIAINHDAAAVALHQANHPQTRHYVSDMFEVDPRAVTQGRRVGLLWASPDCTFHSKARGGKPIRSKERKRRALAWVVTRWAGTVRPRVVVLENVEEFASWGPLVGPAHAQRPCPRRRGRTFRKWVRSLTRLGYTVEWRERRACDSGAPTIRKRLYLIARCDGEKIVWPEPTHGPGRAHPYRTAAECIDWSIPMLSIFATAEEAKAWGRENHQVAPIRPLAEATQRRIARGVMRYVVENPRPFVVGVGGRAGCSPERPLDRPYQTVTAKRDAALVAPVVVCNNANNAPHSVETPVPTVTGGGRNILAAPVLAHLTHYGGVVGSPLDAPKGTVTTIDHDSLVAGALTKLRGTSSDADPAEPLHTVSAQGNHHGLVAAHVTKFHSGTVGHAADEPLHTITSNSYQKRPGGAVPLGLVVANLSHLQSGEPNGGQGDPAAPLRTVTALPKAGLVYSFLQKYYGQGICQEMSGPAPTVTTKDRMGLVTVEVQGEPYVLADIAMRMLQPRELYHAQGFPDSYIIDRGADGRKLTKAEQVRMCGNSVCPPEAAALVRANLPELIVRDEARPQPARARRTSPKKRAMAGGGV